MKILLVFAMVLIHFTSQSQFSNSLGVADFETGLQTSGVQLLDVRTQQEYNTAHIKNALQADWTNKEQFKERISYLDKDKPVYVYCLSGARSSSAAEWMRSNGFSQVFNLSGGINAWRRNDKPIESTIAEAQMTMEDYRNLVTSDSIVLVDFGAKWCPPCVKMEPVLEDLQKDKSLKFKFVKIDAGVHTAIQKQLAIEALPVFLIYKNGMSVWRKQGLVSKNEFLKYLK